MELDNILGTVLKIEMMSTTKGCNRATIRKNIMMREQKYTIRRLPKK
jgi:hypothetical protein